MTKHQPPRASAVLFLCVFLSGASTLIYQIVWQRVLVRILGAALPAVTIILTVFMAGLALGALAAGRKADRCPAPLKVYSWIELALATIGLLFPLATDQRAIEYVLRLVGTCAQTFFRAEPVMAYATPAGAIFINAMLTAVVSLLILVPTLLMGATLPFAVKSLAAARFFSEKKMVEDDRDPQREQSAPSADRVTRGLGKAVASLYTINLLGATVGSLAAAFAILPLAGINNTIRAAAILNLSCSLGLQLLHRSRVIPAEPEVVEDAGAAKTQQAIAASVSAAAPEIRSAPEAMTVFPGAIDKGAVDKRIRQQFSLRQLCVIAGLSSLSALALEVGLTRLFCLVLGSSTYALGAVAGFCLTGFTGGAAIARLILVRRGNLAWQLAAIFAMSAILVTAGLYMIAELPWLLTRFELALSGPSYSVYIVSRCALVCLLVLPTTTAMGVVFPLILGHVARWSSVAASNTGRLFCASTVGSIIGAALAGCLLIPQAIPLSWIAIVFDQSSGIQNTIVFVALMQIVLAAISFIPAAPSCQRSQTIIFSLACSIFGVLIFARPDWQPAAMSSGLSFLPRSYVGRLDRAKFEQAFLQPNSTPLLFYREGQSTTVTVGSTTASNIIFLKNDGKMEAALPLDFDKPAPTSDAPTQVLLGCAPPLFNPVAPRKVFIVGCGSGATSGALLSHPAVTQAAIAEIEPAVYQASSFFSDVNGQPLRRAWRESGRVIPVVADARNLLSISSGGYDAIISQPAEPWVNGATDLYSLEFWSLAKRKLIDHGVFCQWLQLYAIDPAHLSVLIRTFMHEFPNCICLHPNGAGEIILVGFNNPDDQPDLARALERLEQSPDMSKLLSRTGIAGEAELRATIIGTREKLAAFCAKESRLSGIRAYNTDNNLMTEYAAPPHLFDAQDIANQNLQALIGN